MLLVLILSTSAMGLAFYALDRANLARKTMVRHNQKRRALQAMESGIEILHRIYEEDSGCDPGLFLANRKIRSFESAVVMPALIAFRIDVKLPLGNSTGTASGFENYPVQLGPLSVLENLAVIIPGPPQRQWRRILYYDDASSLSKTALQNARRPVENNPVFDFDPVSGSAAAPPLGARDMTFEASVPYPPETPQFVVHQNVVFHNTCVAPTLTSLPPVQLTNFYSVPSSWLGIGPLPRQCYDGPPAHGLGSLTGTTTLSPADIEALRYSLRMGIALGDVPNPYAVLVHSEFDNCADINRDGLLTDLDLALLEKLLSGYISFIPPVYPDYQDASSAHRLTTGP